MDNSPDAVNHGVTTVSMMMRAPTAPLAGWRIASLT